MLARDSSGTRSYAASNLCASGGHRVKGLGAGQQESNCNINVQMCLFNPVMVQVTAITCQGSILSGAVQAVQMNCLC